MATNNFKDQKYTDIIVWNDEEVDICHIEDLMEDVNIALSIFTVSAISGYYCGAQLNIDKLHSDDCDFNNKEDIEYYFNVSVREFKRLVDLDLQTIEVFIENFIKLAPAVKIRKVATFSNGEAMYEEVV